MSGIKRGDLVMVVSAKECCGGGKVGTIFTVDAIDVMHAGRCTDCGVISVSEDAKVVGKNDWVYVRRLKKIDPPATGEYDGVPMRKHVPRKEVA